MGPQALVLSWLKSPLIWFSAPFGIALLVLNLSEEMPFYAYAGLANQVVLFAALLPFFIAYAAVGIACFGIFKQAASRDAVYRTVTLQPYLYAWLIISIFEIVDFPGLPLVSALTGGAERNYTEFGLPTVHGFANLLWLLSCVVAYAKWRAGNSRLFPIVVLLVVWPLLCLSRGMFFILLIILIAIYTSSKPTLRLGRLFWSGVVAASAILPGFAYLGDIRVEDFSLASQFALAEDISPTWLWTYVYLTSPVCNLVNTVDALTPSWSIFPVATLSTLMPTVFKLPLGIETGFEAYIGAPVMPFLNAGTAFRSPYLDWGVIGIVLFSATFGAVAAYIRQRANQYGNLALAFFNAMLFLFIFNNNFFAPTFLFTFLLLMHIERGGSLFPKHPKSMLRWFVAQPTFESSRALERN